jgi:GTPase
MVMVSPSLKPTASLEFEADILVLHHPTTINPRYQAMGKIILQISLPYIVE